MSFCPPPMRRPLLLLPLLLWALLWPPTGCKSAEPVNQVGVEDVAPLSELNVVELTQDLDFTETLSASVLPFLSSQAKVRVECNVTYKYFYDFQNDGYAMRVDQTPAGRVLTFGAPPLKMQRPLVNTSRISYPERSLLINEEDKAVQILETLGDKLAGYGEERLEAPQVQIEAKASLESFLLGLMQQAGVAVEAVEITPYRGGAS